MTPAERKAAQDAAAEAAQAAALAAFAARRKTPAKTVMSSAFSLAEKSAAIKASRPVVSATLTVADAGKVTRSELADRAAVASAVEAEIARAYDAAATNNLAGKARIVKTLSIALEVRVS